MIWIACGFGGMMRDSLWFWEISVGHRNYTSVYISIILWYRQIIVLYDESAWNHDAHQQLDNSSFDIVF